MRYKISAIMVGILFTSTGCNFDNENEKTKHTGQTPKIDVERNEYSGSLIERNYGTFVAIIDCDSRLEIAAMAKIRNGKKDYPRASSFYIDKEIGDCSQKSNSTYSKKLSKGINFQRGHVIDADSFDFSEIAIKNSNYMTNVAPQLGVNNRKGSAWFKIEDQIRCIKKKMPFDKEIILIAGTIDLNNTQDDFFKSSHGVQTPDFFYKIAVIPTTGQVHSWMVSNTQVMLDDDLAKTRTPVDSIIKNLPTYAQDFIISNLPKNYQSLNTSSPLRCQ